MSGLTCIILDNSPKKKLEKVASYPLYGNVVNVQVVKLGNNDRDSLLLSFKDAKVSLNHLSFDNCWYFPEESTFEIIIYLICVTVKAPNIRK